MTPSPQDPQKEKCAGCYKCITRRNVSTGDECASRYHCDCHTIESNVPSEVSQGSEERLSSKIDSPHDLIEGICTNYRELTGGFLPPSVVEQINSLAATMKSEGAREERERIRTFFDTSTDDWSLDSDNWRLLDELLTESNRQEDKKDPI